MGVKFGMEEGTGTLLHANFHPHRCHDKGVGPKKLKFLLRFDQIVEYIKVTSSTPNVTAIGATTITTPKTKIFTEI